MIIVLIWYDKICLELIKIFNQKYAICYDFEIEIASGDNIIIEIFDKIIESKPIDSFYEMDCIFVNCRSDCPKISFDIKHNKTPNSVLIDTTNLYALNEGFIYSPSIHEHLILPNDVLVMPSIETIVIAEVLQCFLKHNLNIEIVNACIVHNHPMTRIIDYKKSKYNEVDLNVIFQLSKLFNKIIRINPQSLYTDGKECIILSLTFDSPIEIDEFILLIGMLNDENINISHINESVHVVTEYNFNIIFNGNKIIAENLFNTLLSVQKNINQ